MHDPNTLAFRMGKWLEIWHVDPCINGDDDSAGWSTPKLTAEDEKNVAEITKWNTNKNLFTKSHFEVVAWIWSRCAFYKFGRNRSLNLAEIEYCLNLAANPTDNLSYPIIHAAEHPESSISRDSSRFVVLCVYRGFMRHHRKWWQHPKWNVTRWRVELHWPKHLAMAIGRKAGETGEMDW